MHKIYEFQSGLKLVYYQIEQNRPLAIYFGVNVGSVVEKANQSGISHFIEHLIFKGTKTRDAIQISKDFEDIGADVNAYTNTKRTMYYAIGLNENLEKTIEILSDIVLNPKFDNADIEKEKKVVFEEIDMRNDDPKTQLYDAFCSMFYKGTGYDKNVTGTKKSLKNIGRDEIVKFYNENYTPKNMVVSITTSYEFDDVVEIVKKYVEDNFAGRVNVNKRRRRKKLKADRRFLAVNKNYAQARVILAFPVKKIKKSKRYVLSFLSFILGGGLSSRLFTKIREENGLVYSIGSNPSFVPVRRSLQISFGANESNCRQTLKLIKSEIEQLVKDGITEQELLRTKALLKNFHICASEKSKYIANNNADHILSNNKVMTSEQNLKKIDSVTKQEIDDLAKEIFDFNKVCGVVLSKNLGEDIFEEL